MTEPNASVPSQAATMPAGAPPANNGASPAAAASKPAPKPKPSTPPMENKDSFREIVETIVFVVVLVLLLKGFVAEAFVIPTGSMAETLYGYQKQVKCPECGLVFPVNCSCEVDPQQPQPPTPVIGAACPNCDYHFDLNRNLPYTTGDRVLVGKFLYDFPFLGMDAPERYHVVVFKFPEKPQRDYVAMNYIKRLIGLPGETIAIHRGNLYVCNDLNFQDEDRNVPEKDLWQYTHKDDPQAIKLFEENKFHILRKPPKTILAEKRLVFDNEHQPLDLVGKVPPRWQAESGWKPDKADEPRIFQSAGQPDGGIAWLRYHNLRRDPRTPQLVKRELITDIMGYNSYVPEAFPGRPVPGQNWVGDLLLECKVKVAEAHGKLVLELSKGVDRFRASWDLSSGMCTLTRLTDGSEKQLEAKPTAVKKPGTYRLCFANVDERLTVWVDNSLPFGDGVVYEPPSAEHQGPTAENDLEPASIGMDGAAVSISELKLYRDTYYTSSVDSNGPDAHVAVNFADPKDWGPLKDLPVKTLYVQPGHFLCLGDNSPESSDGRTWGLVPRRLLLGRALAIYYPFIDRAGRIE